MSDSPGGQKSDGPPRWVRVFWVVALLVVLLSLVLVLTGRHGPSRHGPAGHTWPGWYGDNRTPGVEPVHI